ncbi:hypothetical protein GCM10022409_44930 [Hymenobacter glaciei]|uniref:Peptidoglycan binding-like domain-containing protein n=1 Tax=Hymenobacter glaciei TaxID=877209 RepID=A0ABP7UUD4_9BACT
MNLTSTLVNQRPRRARMMGSAPAAVAILYPKVGNVMRVPLRRTTTRGRTGCEQHPERQFIVWFNRMAAARPGFPAQIKSILLITGQPLCASCHRALATYLSRYYLADKLRLRSVASSCGCGCGGQCSHGADAGGYSPREEAVGRLVLDGLLADPYSDELEEEGWWNRVRDVGRAALLSGALALGPQGVSKPVFDAAKAVAGAVERRRKMQQTVDSNTPPNAPTSGQQEMEYLAGELEAASCPNPGPARPTLRNGARGEYVRYLQCRLNYLHEGLSLPLVEDGAWGPKTQDAVRSFQQAKGLVADAVVGPLTWAKLDAGSPMVPTIPPRTTPGGTPATTDVGLVRFRNAADINAFFVAKTGQGFVDWFRTRVGGRGAWVRTRQGTSTPVTMPATADAKAGFQQFWDGIPLIFNTPQINFAQFAALQSILVNETGGRMRPIAEGVGTAGHPGIAYAFDRIAGLKQSYNKAPNKTALALFNDSEFVRAHGQKPLGAQLANTQDGRWAGDVYPAGSYSPSTDPAQNGFVQEADFYKFRGRGYIQITWRNAYQWLIPSVQDYHGTDPVIRRYQAQWQGLSLDTVATRSSNADWDELFMRSPEFPLSALRVFFGHKSDSINHAAVGDWASVRRVACDVMCTTSYQNLFEQRVRQIFDALAASPAPVGPVPTPGGGAVPQPIPATGHTQAEQRDAIVANALRMMAAPPIAAKQRGADGFRQGWEKLKAIFELAAPAFIGAGWEENNLKRSTAVSNQAGIPHWCGIFAVWATKAAGRPVGTWQIGTGIARTPGFRSITPAQVQRGDIGYINQPYQHHFIVREVHPDGTIDTIDGNSAGTSTVSTKSRVPRQNITGFFSSF